MPAHYRIQCPVDSLYYYYCIKGTPQFGATKSKAYCTADHKEALTTLKHLQQLVSYKVMNLVTSIEKGDVQP